jgi:hypothetical protein
MRNLCLDIQTTDSKTCFGTLYDLETDSKIPTGLQSCPKPSRAVGWPDPGLDTSTNFKTKSMKATTGVIQAMNQVKHRNLGATTATACSDHPGGHLDGPVPPSRRWPRPTSSPTSRAPSPAASPPGSTRSAEEAQSAASPHSRGPSRSAEEARSAASPPSSRHR